MESNSHPEVAEYDVLIVGCGPVGATLANCLRKFGHKVAIFDRDVDVFPVPRAMGFDDEALRLFQALGVLDRIQGGDHSYQFDSWTYDIRGRHLSTLNRDRLGEDLMMGRCGHYYMTICDQPNVERILRDDFALEPKVDCYLGFEVLDVDGDQEQARLSAKCLQTEEQREFTAHYIVGCDGGRSLVRRALDVERIDLGYSEEYLVVDAYVDDENYFRTMVSDGAHFVFDPRHGGVVVKGLHGHVRFDKIRHPDVMRGSYESEDDFAEDAQALIRRNGFDPEKFRVVRHAPYTFYAGMPSTWRSGRLFVAGDAAHQTPPWAGQGLNMGIRDAANLSFKINLVLSGKASDKVLDTYDTERRPVSLETIKGAVANGKRQQTSNPIAIAVRNVVFFLARKSRFVNRLLWKNIQRKPPYVDGLLGKTHKSSGTMMTQPWVEDFRGDRQRLDDLVGLNFALLTTNSPTGPSVYRFVNELDGVVLKLGKDFLDPDATLLKWFQTNKVQAVLMRPDRYIFDAGQEGDALCEALFEAIR